MLSALSVAEFCRKEAERLVWSSRRRVSCRWRSPRSRDFSRTGRPGPLRDTTSIPLPPEPAPAPVPEPPTPLPPPPPLPTAIPPPPTPPPPTPSPTPSARRAPVTPPSGFFGSGGGPFLSSCRRVGRDWVRSGRGKGCDWSQPGAGSGFVIGRVSMKHEGDWFGQQVGVNL